MAGRTTSLVPPLTSTQANKHSFPLTLNKLSARTRRAWQNVMQIPYHQEFNSGPSLSPIAYHAVDLPSDRAYRYDSRIARSGFASRHIATKDASANSMSWHSPDLHVDPLYAHHLDNRRTWTSVLRLVPTVLSGLWSGDRGDLASFTKIAHSYGDQCSHTGTL
jgi:hypothetical protein